MKDVRMLIVLMLLSFGSSAVLGTQQSKPTNAVAYLCSGLTGASIMAPKWQFDADGMAGQSVRIVFAGDGEPATVRSSMGAKTYYEGSGVGISMGAGFVILIVDRDRIETYTYSAGSMELLFGSTRAGNQLLPNAVKAFRGTCVPDGNK